MPLLRRLVPLALLAALGPGAAWACTPEAPGRRIDWPNAVAFDGSFLNAAMIDDVQSFRGNPVRVRGGGRVAQVITAGNGCSTIEWLLFVDCTAGEAIVVQGLSVSDPDNPSPFFETSTLLLQPPRGPLSITAITTVAEVAALAAREGWQVKADVPAWAAERGRRNAFDPFLGCRLFYPGTAGAGG